MTPLRREVERLLEAGSRCGVPKTAGTCRDILKRREALWTFVQVAGVEPTNNTAERSIRPGVLWRKGSFGTQSAEGSRFVESMMTVVATLKQQQRNVLEYLTAACEAALRGEAAPSLLPESHQKVARCGVIPVFTTCTVTPLPSTLLERLAISVATGEARRLYAINDERAGAQRTYPENPLLYVPSDPVRSLDQALKAAGIPKVTEAGKVDFHACRV